MLIPFIKLIDYIDIYMLITIIYANLNLIISLFLYYRINKIDKINKENNEKQYEMILDNCKETNKLLRLRLR